MGIYSYNISIFAKSLLLTRIVQQNDWVVFIIVGCILLYVFMLIYLHRDSTVRVFLMQKFADSSNNYLSWLIVSAVFAVLLAVFISQSIPVVPKEITDVQLFGYELNKFGFTMLSLVVFYSLKSGLSYLFFAGTGSLKRWRLFQFAASKFYFVFSLVLMFLCVYQYYFEVDGLLVFDFYFIGFGAIFLFKIFFYLLSPNDILPEKWYYKLLYLCTLQLAPLMVIWTVLFI